MHHKNPSQFFTHWVLCFWTLYRGRPVNFDPVSFNVCSATNALEHSIHCMRLVAELQKVFVDLTDNEWMKIGSADLNPLQL